MLDYILSKDNIHIVDSYKIFDRDTMLLYLEDIKSTIKNSELCEIFEVRSMSSLIHEWRAHNLLYDLHLFRSHTKDVDLDNNSKFILFLYAILSVFYIKL